MGWMVVIGPFCAGASRRGSNPLEPIHDGPELHSGHKRQRSVFLQMALEPKLQIAIVTVYIVTYVAIIGLMLVRGGRNQMDKVISIAVSLPLLAGVGYVRGAMLSGDDFGLLLGGPLLNISILLGTGGDPYRAILKVGEYRSLKGEGSRVGRVLRFGKRRDPKKMPAQWPVLLMFFGAISIIAFFWPSWFGLEDY